MEIKYYFSIVKRWAWLLVLGLILGTAGGYYFSSKQTPIYQTSTRVLVMSALKQGSADTTYLFEYQLAQTYMQLLTTTPIMEGTSERLGYEVSASQIKTEQAQNTQIMIVTVEDDNPQHATDIANTVVGVLLDVNEEMQTGRYGIMEESLNAQVAQMKTPDEKACHLF